MVCTALALLCTLNTATALVSPDGGLLAKSRQHPTRRMMDTDVDDCQLDGDSTGLGEPCQWVDVSKASISGCGQYSSYSYSKAVDGNRNSYYRSSSGTNRYWRATFPEKKRFSVVDVHSRSWNGAIDIAVDGVVCARMRGSGRAPCDATGKEVRITLDKDSSSTLYLYEVRLAEIPNIHGITCPFLGTLVHEKVLNGCVHTKEKLLEVTLASGLKEDLAVAHIESNFKNNPSGIQDVCDMEGALNEHKTSTGINDCPTDFGGTEGLCSMPHDDYAAVCPSKTPNKECGVPNANVFGDFFVDIDADGDNYITVTELQQRADEWQFNDANPIGLGSISGSFGLMLEIFGQPGPGCVQSIYRPELERLVLERRFPHGFVFGQHGKFRRHCNSSSGELV